MSEVFAMRDGQELERTSESGDLELDAVLFLRADWGHVFVFDKLVPSGENDPLN